ncbi:hypothetical protein PAXY110619_27330 [Paenibacillus xylanexedens]|uniref:Uncharacterized protein n=1 Tax=Paenibacillus xylanexedens TaxID=528191 RepID=A0ABS4S0P2_PAEXY|nr:hypothetical protein [Paenibacillus xylanexedens]
MNCTLLFLIKVESVFIYLGTLDFIFTSQSKKGSNDSCYWNPHFVSSMKYNCNFKIYNSDDPDTFN